MAEHFDGFTGQRFQNWTLWKTSDINLAVEFLSQNKQSLLLFSSAKGLEQVKILAVKVASGF